jgi:hypothetical protein
MSEFDTPQWRVDRDARLMAWVQNPYAVQFILAIGDAAELWDDLIDQDKPIHASDVNRVFATLTTVLPLNPFFDANKLQLIPLLVAGINAWHDATELEKGSDNDKALAYVLRDWYVELTMFVVYLTRGQDTMRTLSLEIRRFFSQHESLHDYMEKLS